MAKHLCPGCGKFYFDEEDNFQVCLECGWENDGVQEDDPDYDGGANHISLNEHRKLYLAGKAKGPRIKR